MKSLDLFMQRWQDALNHDPVLQKRNNHIKSTIPDGKDVFELSIHDTESFSVKLDNKSFAIRKGKADHPLIRWEVPQPLLKKVLLGEERIAYAFLDEECSLSFDTPNCTHWNGATALAVILMTREMVKKDPEIKKIAESL
jgi:hypothetical protein